MSNDINTTLESIMDSAPNNEVIKDALFRTYMYISEHEKPLCSISGGADSDVILDICYRCDVNKKVTYVWFDTGLEYKATKEHLNYLEQKYNIKIERNKAAKTIPYTCYTLGAPFINKYVSEMMYRLQMHNFQWEDEPFDELYAKYPKCKIALKWWCNENGDGDSFNIKRTPYLKEFIIENPPTFKISNKCCDYAKKDLSHKTIKHGQFDMCIVGIRKAEGGLRSMVHKSCFAPTNKGYDNYYPILWFTNKDRAEYEQHYGITHSKCYTEYGLKRTGCAGCPFAGNNLEFELNTIQKFEPVLFRAVNKLFKNSYEYTQQFKKFKQMRSVVNE